MEFTQKENYTLYDLVALVARLRGENGCAWDREQTHLSLRRNLLEEAYEAADAMDRGDTENLLEELGDVLLQVIFHAGIEKDAGRFDIETVADAECKKLVSRHKHVFAPEGEKLTAGEIPDAWEEIKKAERSQKTVAETMQTVARSLPSLWRAEKIRKKAAAAGAEGDTAELISELEAAVSRLKAESEAGRDCTAAVGSAVFALAGVARSVGADPEDAGHAACDMYVSRFEKAEGEKDPAEFDLSERRALLG